MQPKELKKLIKTLRDAGVNYYKDGDLELKLGDEPSPIPVSQPVKALTPEEEKEIVHKIEKVRELYLGSDEDLLNRLFPDPVNEQVC